MSTQDSSTVVVTPLPLDSILGIGVVPSTQPEGEQTHPRELPPDASHHTAEVDAALKKG